MRRLRRRQRHRGSLLTCRPSSASAAQASRAIRSLEAILDEFIALKGRESWVHDELRRSEQLARSVGAALDGFRQRGGGAAALAPGPHIKAKAADAEPMPAAAAAQHATARAGRRARAWHGAAAGPHRKENGGQAKLKPVGPVHCNSPSYAVVAQDGAAAVRVAGGAGGGGNGVVPPPDEGIEGPRQAVLATPAAALGAPCSQLHRNLFPASVRLAASPPSSTDSPVTGNAATVLGVARQASPLPSTSPSQQAQQPGSSGHCPQISQERQTLSEHQSSPKDWRCMSVAPASGEALEALPSPDAPCLQALSPIAKSLLRHDGPAARSPSSARKRSNPKKRTRTTSCHSPAAEGAKHGHEAPPPHDGLSTGSSAKPRLSGAAVKDSNSRDELPWHDTLAQPSATGDKEAEQPLAAGDPALNDCNFEEPLDETSFRAMVSDMFASDMDLPGMIAEAINSASSRGPCQEGLSGRHEALAEVSLELEGNVGDLAVDDILDAISTDTHMAELLEELACKPVLPAAGEQPQELLCSIQC
eukprot:SM000255S08761  [mRNA]  locus=s255:38481:40908:+ [translate_table: standard]